MGEWNNRKEQSKKRSISFFLIIILIISGLPFIFDIGSENSNVSAAATHYVGGVGAGNYSKIQYAIDNASWGDTIRVYAGTYYENIIVDKTVTLIGNGSANTTIDGGGSEEIVHITADWVNVTGFMIINGSNSVGIDLYSVSNCKISNINCSDCVYGINLKYSSSNTIANNTCNSNAFGIYLSESSSNTLVNNTYNSNNAHGISLHSYSNSNTLANNNCSSNGQHGIYLHSSLSNTIENNTCNSNDYGIYLQASSRNTLTNNTCNSNSQNAINLYFSSSSNTIVNNTCNGNDEQGISLVDFSHSNTLANNNCSSNGQHGIYLEHSPSSTLVNNTMVEDGIYISGNLLEHWNTHLINTSNKVNGKPVYYWKNVTGGVVPSGAGQVILANCNNVIVENQNVSNGSVGILLGFSTKNNITNNTCNGNIQYGIYLHKSSSNTFANNTFSNNEGYGAYLTYSPSNTLAKNTCNSNDDYGIYLKWTSNSNTLANNTFNSNGVGIYLHSSPTNNTLANNTCNSNGIGIYMVSSNSNTIANNTCNSNGDYGIHMDSSNSNTLANNTCYWNNNIGIYLAKSSGSTIANNTCNSNNNYGIYMYSSNNNTIANNTCLNNRNGIYIYFSSSSNTIVNNTCNSNNYDGILLSQLSNYNMFDNNTCNENGQHGIYLYSSSNGNTIMNNTIASNTIDGINITSSNNNTIYHNNFISNTKHAYDDGTNFWNASYPLGGNYWDNWTSPDDNGDGFVDFPCNISGGKNKDYWPFAQESLWKCHVHNLDKNTWHLTIQEGIDKADPGNTIRVGSGTYYENVIVNKTINLTGEDRDTTVIDGGWSGDVVYVTADWVNVSGFTARNSGSIDWPNYDCGIEINNAQYCRIENNTCHSNNLNGIYIAGSSNTLKGNNCSSNSDFGIRISGSGNRLDNNTCNWNTNSGIYIDASKSNLVTNSTCLNNVRGIMLFGSNQIILNNNCSLNGNGIYIEENLNAGHTIANNLCNSNAGSGIYLYHSGKNEFNNNTCFNNRRGIFMQSSSNNKVANNICNSNSIYGIYLDLSSNNLVQNNTCNKNDYHGICLQSSPSNNTLINNSCNSNNRSGIMLRDSPYNNIINCTFLLNNNVDISLEDKSNNTAINTTFDSIYIDPTSKLIVQNYLHIQVNGSTGSPLPGADVQVKDGSDVIYATSGYGGSDVKTNTAGRIEWIVVTDKIYNMNTTPTENTTFISVKYMGLTFRNNDRDVNMSTSHFEYFGTNLLPTVVILNSPSTDSFIDDLTPELKWLASTDGDLDQLTYFVEVDEFGGDWSSLAANHQTGTGVVYWTLTTGLTEGQAYQWRVRAHDSITYGSWSSPWKFTIDTLAPTAPIGVTSTPTGWTNKNSFDINWTDPADTSGVVTGAYYRLDSPPTSPTEGIWVGTNPITNISVSGDGAHTIYIWLKDSMGHINHLNYGTSELRYDGTPPDAPVASSTSHQEDTWTANNAPTFNWSIPSDLSGIIGYSYVLDRNSDTAPDTISEGAASTTIFTNQADGVWYFHLRAVDEAGNWGPVDHYKIKVDAVGPSAASAVITIDGGAVYSNDLVLNLQWSNFIDIDGSGIAGYYYSFENNGGTSVGTWTTSTNGILMATAEGETTVYVWAKDNVGNIGLATAASIEVKLPTTTALELSSEKILRTETITFTSNCDDPSDMENKLTCEFQYKTGDGAWQDLTSNYVTDPSGCWQAEFTPGISAELRTYYVQVRYTNLNETSTNWTVRSFTVENNAPVVQNPIADFSIAEDHSDATTVNLNSIFSDVDTSTLDFSLSGNVHIAITISPDGSVLFTPEENWNGFETITFYASDKIATPTPEEVKITILPVNDIPIAVIDTEIRTSILGQKLTIEGHGEDVDGTIIEYNWTSNIDGRLSDTLTLDTSTISYGVHTLSFSVKDSDGIWSIPVIMSFKVTAPDLVIEDIKLSSDDITEGETVEITATITNQGDAEATNITVVIYDGDKKIGSKTIEVIAPNSSAEVSINWEPDKGDHSVKVLVLAEGEDIIESDTDNNQLTLAMNAKTDWTPFIIMIIIVIIIVVIIVLMSLRAKRDREKVVETISEMEAEIEQAKKLGLPAAELEKVLLDAKRVRKVESIGKDKKIK